MCQAFADDMMVVSLADSETLHHNLMLRKDENPFTPFTPKYFGKTIDEDDYETWCDVQAIQLFIKDYLRRCGFKKVVLGLSGGIDSAAVAALAADTIGGMNVIGISLPSEGFSSEGSVTDAAAIAATLHLDYREIGIGDLHNLARSKILSGGKQKFENSVTDENLQPRLRALLLMAISNDECALLLTTGNKSEITVGYCTLYGDMCGGIAPISDMWKTHVFRMCRFINKYRGEIIPNTTLTKPPSAELKPDQKDTDSLPPYDDLDPFLEEIVEGEKTFAEYLLAHNGDVPKWAQSIYRKYRNSEFKRQQMPPGAKLRPRSFGSGRRIPIAEKETSL